MTGDRSQRRLRSALVVAEVALALMLVSGTGLLLRSFVNLLNVDTGFRKDGVMVLQMFAWDRNPGPVALAQFLTSACARRSAPFPGVEAVGAVQAMPFIESNVDIQERGEAARSAGAAAGEEIRSSYQHRDARLLRGDGRAAASRAACSTIATAPTRRASWWSAKRSRNAICAASIRSASASNSAPRASRSQARDRRRRRPRCVTSGSTSAPRAEI